MNCYAYLWNVSGLAWQGLQRFLLKQRISMQNNPLFPNDSMPRGALASLAADIKTAGASWCCEHSVRYLSVTSSFCIALLACSCISRSRRVRVMSAHATRHSVASRRGALRPGIGCWCSCIGESGYSPGSGCRRCAGRGPPGCPAGSVGTGVFPWVRPPCRVVPAAAV